MRKDPLVTREYYHIYNRGVDKRDIFSSKKDLDRFALSAKEFNSVVPIGSIKDKKHKKPADSDVGRPNPLVSIVAYCFNPNHFHFILKQEVDGGISEFFKRLLGGYTKYFNLVHSRTGALFQGRFKSQLIDDEPYFLKIRPYVHVNYMVHNIPKERMHLVLSSEKEYDTKNFILVSEKEAGEVLEFYGGNENYKKECLNVVSFVRAERGLENIEDDPSPTFGRPTSE
ncbi:MAG: transposase [Candidatus Paceibacterota bacterium]|jgi:REP element-mobilizing transposase RayT